MASETTNGDNNLVAALLASLENERRLIAAGKLQCWELVKWVVTLNIAIAGAQVATLNATAARSFVSRLADSLCLSGTSAMISCVTHATSGCAEPERRPGS